MIIAYIRKSTEKQEFAHMAYEIKAYASKHKLKINKWVQESISSRMPLQKRELGALLASLKSGDILITTEISRLGRSLLEVMNILQICLNKNCQVITTKEHYHLGNDLQSQVLAFAFGLSAQIERDLISERTRAALTAKKAQGVKLGRPFGAEFQKLSLTENIKRVKSLLKKGLSQAKVSKTLEVNPQTLSRFLRRKFCAG